MSVNDPNSAIDPLELRQQSLNAVSALGYPTNAALPLLDRLSVARQPCEVARRALVLHACSAASYGFPVERARGWITENSLSADVSPEEQVFLADGAGAEAFRVRPEALWALTWVLGLADDFQLHEAMPQDAVARYPDLRRESAAAWLGRCAKTRSNLEVALALDFYYCVHWALVEDRLQGRYMPNALPEYIVVERRRALEWCFGEASWDEISLDT